MEAGKGGSGDIDSVAKIIDNVGKAMNQGGSCFKDNGSSIIKVITDCSNQHSVSINCWQIERFLEGLSKGFNQDLEFSYISKVFEGGKNCIWALRKQERV
jgi:hypothetical protein